jgi:PAS domain S-box-containing protein
MDEELNHIKNTQPIKVLLVEDNPADAHLVREMLQAQQAESFELSHAENLTKGLQLLVEKKPDVVLLDLGLPESRGLETIQKVRPLASDAPIIILAEPDDEIVGMQAVHWGAQDFLIKWETTDTVLKRTVRYALERKRRTDESRQMDIKYSTIFNNMINGFVLYEVVKDENGAAKDVRYLDINPAFERMMGMKHQDVIGKTLLELFPKIDPKWINVYAKIAKEGGSLKAERDRYDNGQYFDTTIFNVQPNYVAVMFMDITERKKAEKRMSDLAKFPEENPSPVIRISDENVVFYANPASETLLKLWKTQVGKKLPDAIFNRFKEIWSSGLDCEIEINLEDKAYHFLIFYTASNNYASIYANDITERKKAEQEVLKLNQELEQRVKDRTDKLVAANKQLQTFGYTVSHDLRAPLRTIDNFARIIVEDYADKLDVSGKNHLDVIRRSAEHLKNLINNLLEFSRTGMEKMTIKQIDLRPMAKMVFDTIGSAEPKRNISLVIKELPVALADELLICQVLINLLSNAIKFTRMKSEAIIEFGGEQKDNMNLYYIKDNGAGFDMQYAAKLFSIFHRLHKEDEFEGTGVGLAIAQQIIQMHGGDIYAESKVNEGATFYFTLPR